MSESTVLGSSMRGGNLSTLIENKNYSIVCGIEVQNWTKYELKEARSTVTSGHLSSPPVSISPGHKEAMVCIL